MTRAASARSRTVHDRTDAIERHTRPHHFAGLEALRALAATMVVVHHVASVSGSDAGLLGTPAEVMDAGVAIFFVLSGFLIFRPFAVALILGRPAQRTAAFWWRRVLRIVPAYWLALTVLWSLGNFHLGADWWRHYLFLQPFDRYTALAGLVPAWSLSTELCFYLLIPPFAGLVRRISSARGADDATRRERAIIVGLAVLALGLVGPIARATAPTWAGEDRALAFQWLPTNLDLFAAGMLLAVGSAWTASDERSRVRIDALARPAWAWWGGAAALFLAYAYVVGGVEFAVGHQGWSWQRRQVSFTLCAVLLLVPAVFGAQDQGLLRRVWGWQPLVWVGSVSYGLYLWHVGILERLVDRPVNPFTGSGGWDGWLPDRFDPPDVVLLLALTLGLALGAAAISWYLLERPLQRFKGMLDSVAARG